MEMSKGPFISWRGLERSIGEVCTGSRNSGMSQQREGNGSHGKRWYLSTRKCIVCREERAKTEPRDPS